MTYEQAQGYLAAMIDGEGCVGKYVPERLGSRRVDITNTDERIVAQTELALDTLGIRYTTACTQRNGRPYAWHIRIMRRDELVKVRDLPLGSTRKRERLDVILASYEYFPPPLAELRHLYVDKKMSMREIAERHGCTSNAIRNAMVRGNLARRSKSEATRLALERA